MPVEINDILHVLAHELRTPVGIAHGYVRLLLEDRLPKEADRRRALEQMQKALGRLSDLSHETSALAAWYEHDGAHSACVDAKALMTRVADADYDSPVTVDGQAVAEHAQVRTADGNALCRALVAVVRATARELRGETCDVIGRTHNGVFELVAGPDNLIDELSAGPDAADATPIVLERGGLGLALVHAAIVLDAHGGARWTMNGKRQMLGVRLPLEERRD
jgi:hypothetical protein